MSFSGFGLALSAFPVLVHGSEWLFPMHARFLGSILPIFSFNLWSSAGSSDTWLTLDDSLDILQKGIDSAPSEKWRAASDYLFVMTFESRQGSCGFVGAAVAALYAATLPLSQRHPLHVLFMTVAVLMTYANLHHATSLPLGYNPMVTPAGRGLGWFFVPFWVATFYCNYMGFVASKEALLKEA